MEKEKKPKVAKKTTTTTANQNGAVQSIESKKPAPKKKSALTEMSSNGLEAKKTAQRKKTVAMAPLAEPRMTQMKVSHDDIARLAHRYWAERGGQHGSHVEDWLRAERELRGKAS